MSVEEWLSDIIYDPEGQNICKNNNNFDLIANIRGWSTLSKLFPTMEETGKFQDKVGEFIVQAIKEKTEKLKIPENLENAANSFAWEYDEDFDNYTEIKKGFINGAKWQAERMYSKEDMWEAYKDSNTVFDDKDCLREEFEKWFEQFKKRNNE